MPKKATRYDRMVSTRVSHKDFNALTAYCATNDKNVADVLRQALQCYLYNGKCQARERWRG